MPDYSTLSMPEAITQGEPPSYDATYRAIDCDAFKPVGNQGGSNSEMHRDKVDYGELIVLVEEQLVNHVVW